jgi:hypothetical protein
VLGIDPELNEDVWMRSLCPAAIDDGQTQQTERTQRQQETLCATATVHAAGTSHICSSDRRPRRPRLTPYHWKA